jgi:hypothetical protein
LMPRHDQRKRLSAAFESPFNQQKKNSFIWLLFLCFDNGSIYFCQISSHFTVWFHFGASHVEGFFCKAFFLVSMAADPTFQKVLSRPLVSSTWSFFSANDFLMCYFLHHKAAKYDGDLIKKNVNDVQRSINGYLKWKGTT